MNDRQPQPQPQRPPRREIEAGTNAWPRQGADEDEDLLAPAQADPYRLTPEFRDAAPAGYANRLTPDFERDQWDERDERDGFVLAPSFDQPRADFSLAPEVEVEAPPERPASPGPGRESGSAVPSPQAGFDPGREAAPAPGPAPGDGIGQRGIPGRGSYRVDNPAPPVADDPSADEAWVPEPGANTMRLGIWGAPGSGKTTYLAAIKHDAASRAGDEIGTWKIIPRTEASEQLLTQWTQLLVGQQEFPEATPLGGWTDLWWHFIGDLSGSRYARRRMGMFRPPPPLTSEFDLGLIDVSGEAFGYKPTDRHVPESTVRRTLAHLAESDGLVFLFDPISERDSPNVATYVERVLNNLSRRMLNQGRLVDGYLPHHIAICVAKTDNVELVEQARRAGLVNTGPDGIDRVLNRQAEGLFNAICENGFWEDDDRRHGGAAFVRNQLRTYFHPKRTRYYAISAIGHQNLTTINGVVKINGPIRPFNVLEPLVELHMQLRNQA